jgi:hypothetical protein
MLTFSFSFVSLIILFFVVQRKKKYKTKIFSFLSLQKICKPQALKRRRKTLFRPPGRQRCKKAQKEDPKPQGPGIGLVAGAIGPVAGATPYQQQVRG